MIERWNDSDTGSKNVTVIDGSGFGLIPIPLVVYANLQGMLGDFSLPSIGRLGIEFTKIME